TSARFFSSKRARASSIVSAATSKISRSRGWRDTSRQAYPAAQSFEYLNARNTVHITVSAMKSWFENREIGTRMALTARYGASFRLNDTTCGAFHLLSSSGVGCVGPYGDTAPEPYRSRIAPVIWSLASSDI